MFSTSSASRTFHGLLRDYRWREVQPGASFLEHLGCRPLGTAPKGLVIGAGVCGSWLATELQAVGFDVTCLEARQRLGGRTRSTALEQGGWYDDGGELVGRNQYMWRFASQSLGLELVEIREYEGPFSPVLSCGSFSRERAHDVFAQMKKAVTPLEKTAARVDLSAPWLGPEAALLDATSVGAWLDSLSLSPDARAALEVQFVANQGATSTYEINLLAFAALAAAHTDAQAGMSFFGDTETHRIRGGAQQLAERAARKLQHPVVLGCNLLGIERRKNGIRAMTSLGPFDADFIVVTIPASLWQHIELPDECRPPAVRMSSNTKFFVHTRRRAETFRAGLSPLALASSGESGLLQIFWEATEGQPGDEAVYAAFSGGPAAETLNSLPEQTRAERCLAEMELLFPGIGSLVTQTRFAGWPGKRWTLGGYSCPAPGDVLARWPSLREGAHPVHFAGEACSNFWGFMQGALDSAAQKAWHLYHHYDGCC